MKKSTLYILLSNSSHQSARKDVINYIALTQTVSKLQLAAETMIPRLRSILNHLRYIPSATSTIHNTNTACCTIPPVQSDYKPQGSFKSVGSFDKVYVTGPSTSNNAIVCVYDIFGSEHYPSLLVVINDL